MATAKTPTKKTAPARKAPPKAAVSRVAPKRPKPEPPKPRWSEQYERAVAAFSSALVLAQQKKHADAIAAFDALIEQYHREADLLDIVDRARSWREASRRHAGKVPVGSDDPILNGVYHANRGEYDLAVKHFEQALAANASSDRALYALAAVHALKGERTPAISRLRQAIEHDDRNRIYALNDADFDPVRDEPEFIDLVEPAMAEEPPPPAPRAVERPRALAGNGESLADDEGDVDDSDEADDSDNVDDAEAGEKEAVTAAADDTDDTQG